MIVAVVIGIHTRERFFGFEGRSLRGRVSDLFLQYFRFPNVNRFVIAVFLLQFFKASLVGEVKYQLGICFSSRISWKIFIKLMPVNFALEKNFE